MGRWLKLSGAGAQGPAGSSAPANPVSPVYSVSATEVGPRILDPTDQTTHTTVQAVVQELVTPATGNDLGTILELQISYDNGTTWGDYLTYIPDRTHMVGIYWQTTIDLPPLLVLTVSQNIKVRAWAATQYVDGGPGTAVASSTCVVSAIGIPIPTGCVINIIESGTFYDAASGAKLWLVHLRIDTPGTGDAWAFQVTRQNTDVSGTPGTLLPGDTSDVEAGVPPDFPNDGTSHDVTLTGIPQPLGSGYHYIRLKVYAFSRTATVATPVNSWQDPTYSVLQQWASLGGATNVKMDYGALNDLTQTTLSGQGANKIVNPGAEIGFLGWKTGGSLFDVDTTQHHTGSYSFRCADATIDATLFQTFKASAGQRWRWGGWAYGNASNNTTVKFQITFIDASNGSLGTLVAVSSVNPAASWNYVSGDVVAPANTDKMNVIVLGTLTAAGATAPVYVDDLWLQQIVTSDLIGPAAVNASAMASAAITAANGAMHDLAQVTTTSTIFSTDVIFSRGISAGGQVAPIVIIHQDVGTPANSGLFLYGQSDASTGATGLTSKPFVAIQSGGILVAQKVNGASVFVEGSSGTIWFYSVNGSISDPYAWINSLGMTVVKALYSFQVTASGVQAFYNGTAYFTVSNDGANVQCIKSGITSEINTTTLLGDTIGFQSYTTSGSAYPTAIGPGVLSMSETTSANLRVRLVASPTQSTLSLRQASSGGNGFAELDSSNGLRLRDSSGSLKTQLDQFGILEINGLPSSSPGAGTKQFWYDPSDGNRVKFAV